MLADGGNCLKYLIRRWNRKEGRGNKDFKKGRQAGSRGECLRGVEPPDELCYLNLHNVLSSDSVE